MELHGTAAVVTGAASGLGAAVVTALVDRGVAVLGIDLPEAIDAVRDPRAGVAYAAADVADASGVAAALAALDPGRPLRIAVNCAGIAPARRILSRGGTHDLELFRRVVDVNLTGTFNVLRLTSEIMAGTAPVDDDGQRGVIINTASIAAFEGQIGQAAYAASKGGIVSLTIAAARDLARTGIRVNTIAPGVVDTPLLASLGPEVAGTLGTEVPFPARPAAPEEFARLVCTILEHDYLNGETIRMDGALRLGP